MGLLAWQEGEPLITRCPNCSTSFRVNDAQLNAANGAVRCGACLLVFSARDNLITEPRPDEDWEDSAEMNLESEFIEEDEHWYPDTAIPSLAAETDDVKDPEEDEAEFFSAVDDDELYLDAVGEAPFDDDSEYDEEAERDEDVPSDPDIDVTFDEDDVGLEAGFRENIRVETHPDEVVGSPEEIPVRKTALWVLGAFVMGAVLLLQVAWFHHDELAQDPGYRAWFVTACNWLGCPIPDYRDRTSLNTTSLVVRSHAEFDNALRVDALLRNDAPFRQVFPVLDLRFTNTRNEVVAARRFKPDEYLGGELTGLRYIPARTEVRISLEVVDPGEDALGYSLTVAGHW